MTPTAVGLLFGALLGIATAVEGWSGLLWTLLFATVFSVIGKVVQGDIDISPYVGATEQRLRTRR